MFLLIDPYANRHLSMSEIKLLNNVAGVIAGAHDDLDLEQLAGAIKHAYRAGMQPHALKAHVERDLGLDTHSRLEARW
jgi:hypothetical protein